MTCRANKTWSVDTNIVSCVGGYCFVPLVVFIYSYKTILFFCFQTKDQQRNILKNNNDNRKKLNTKLLRMRDYRMENQLIFRIAVQSQRLHTAVLTTCMQLFASTNFENEYFVDSAGQSIF
jgi:hypothetical protein